MRRVWPYIQWFSCQKYRIYTVHTWFWPTLVISTPVEHMRQVTRPFKCFIEPGHSNVCVWVPQSTHGCVLSDTKCWEGHKVLRVNRTSESSKQEVIDYFEATDIVNPVYMMAFSGARGNVSQVRQLVGMSTKCREWHKVLRVTQSTHGCVRTQKWQPGLLDVYVLPQEFFVNVWDSGRTR